MKKLTYSALLIVLAAVIWLFWASSPATAPESSGIAAKQTKSPASSARTKFNKEQFSLTNPASQWVIVNKTRPLKPIDYAPADLTSVGNGQEMRAAAATALESMFSSAKKSGLTLTAASGYRSYNEQVRVYGSEVKAFGRSVADSESARPGYSEHQTGWAVDVAGGGCYINDCFATTPEGEWVANNAYKFGFIIRYPKAEENTTGYRFEPWHIRFVGVSLSSEMHNLKISTLEDFFGLPPAPNYE